MIKLVYTYACDACGKQNDETYTVSMGDASTLPKPSVPWFWRCVNQALYCEDHEVTVKVKKARKVKA